MDHRHSNERGSALRGGPGHSEQEAATRLLPRNHAYRSPWLTAATLDKGSPDDADAVGLHMHGLGTQFQEEVINLEQPFECSMRLSDTLDAMQTFDWAFDARILKIAGMESGLWGLSPLCNGESSRPNSHDNTPLLSEGSSSHSSYDSTISSTSVESYTPTISSREAPQHIIYNNMARIDSLLFPVKRDSGSDSVFLHNNEYTLHEDATLHRLMNLHHEPGSISYSITREYSYNERSVAPLPLPDIPRSTPCRLDAVENLVTATDRATPLPSKSTIDNTAQAQTSVCAGDPDMPISASVSNNDVGLARPCFVGVRPTAQENNITFGRSRLSQSVSSHDVPACLSDTDSHSDFEWSTITTTSVSDIAQLRHTSIRQQGHMAYLRYLEAALKFIFRHFARWSCHGQRSQTNGPTQPPCRPHSTTAARTGSSPKFPSQKRGRTALKKPGSQDEEDEDEEGDDLRPGKKARVTSAEDQGLVFACPYFKLVPREHSGCLSLTLRRLRDVKQHLVRRHLRPPFCPICGRVFKAQTEQEDHVQERSCEKPLDYRKPPGITQEHREKLSSKSDRNLPPEEQWFCVWDIIFPGLPRPDSAYISEPFVEVTRECETFWEERGEAIFSEWLAVSGIPQDVPGENSMLPVLFLDCSRHMFELFRRQYAITASGRGPSASRLMARAGPSSRGGTTLVEEPLADLDQARSESRGELLGETTASPQHSITMANIGTRPAPLDPQHKYELLNTAPAAEDSLIAQNRVSMSASQTDTQNAQQPEMESDWPISSHTDPGLDDSYLFDYMNLDGLEFNATTAGFGACNN